MFFKSWWNVGLSNCKASLLQLYRDYILLVAFFKWVISILTIVYVIQTVTMSEEDFPFPFQPYQVQEDFMRSLYDTIEKGQVGIFESPTGTGKGTSGGGGAGGGLLTTCQFDDNASYTPGKSLSIICSAVKWLKDNQKRKEGELAACQKDPVKDQDEPDWVNDQFQEQKVIVSSYYSSDRIYSIAESLNI